MSRHLKHLNQAASQAPQAWSKSSTLIKHLKQDKHLKHLKQDKHLELGPGSHLKLSPSLPKVKGLLTLTIGGL
ncbi:hypothetical protein DD606_26035 [Enterobacter cloacae complex sp. GF14B]|nr:hypothetical protein DD606_26035 [Enterobacter cloacae complex sp. GF14B]